MGNGIHIEPVVPEPQPQGPAQPPQAPRAIIDIALNAVQSKHRGPTLFEKIARLFGRIEYTPIVIDKLIEKSITLKDIKKLTKEQVNILKSQHQAEIHTEEFQTKVANAIKEGGNAVMLMHLFSEAGAKKYISSLNKMNLSQKEENQVKELYNSLEKMDLKTRLQFMNQLASLGVDIYTKGSLLTQLEIAGKTFYNSENGNWVSKEFILSQLLNGTLKPEGAIYKEYGNYFREQLEKFSLADRLEFFKDLGIDENNLMFKQALSKEMQIEFMVAKGKPIDKELSPDSPEYTPLVRRRAAPEPFTISTTADLDHLTSCLFTLFKEKGTEEGNQQLIEYFKKFGTETQLKTIAGYKHNIIYYNEFRDAQTQNQIDQKKPLQEYPFFESKDMYLEDLDSINSYLETVGKDKRREYLKTSLAFVDHPRFSDLKPAYRDELLQLRKDLIRDTIANSKLLLPPEYTFPKDLKFFANELKIINEKLALLELEKSIPYQNTQLLAFISLNDKAWAELDKSVIPNDLLAITRHLRLPNQRTQLDPTQNSVLQAVLKKATPHEQLILLQHHILSPGEAYTRSDLLKMLDPIQLFPFLVKWSREEVFNSRELKGLDSTRIDALAFAHVIVQGRWPKWDNSFQQKKKYFLQCLNKLSEKQLSKYIAASLSNIASNTVSKIHADPLLEEFPELAKIIAPYCPDCKAKTQPEKMP